MEVTVNQQIYTVPDDCNVQALLTNVLHQQANGLAIAIGETIIPQIQWEGRLLKSGDHVIIIKATQGG